MEAAPRKNSLSILFYNFLAKPFDRYEKHKAAKVMGVIVTFAAIEGGLCALSASIYADAAGINIPSKNDVAYAFGSGVIGSIPTTLASMFLVNQETDSQVCAELFLLVKIIASATTGQVLNPPELNILKSTAICGAALFALSRLYDTAKNALLSCNSGKASQQAATTYYQSSIEPREATDLGLSGRVASL